MADEPKNNIEDALKAYAGKRREEAGAFEMHPATRHMLQSEAAKLRPKPANKPRSWLVALFEFGPKWGFALSILVVLAVMYLAWRSPSARMDMASTQTKAPAVAADGDRLSTGERDPVRIAKDAERRRALLSEEIRDKQVTAETEQLGRSSDFRRKSEAADEKLKLGVEVVLQDRTPAPPMPAAPAPTQPTPATEPSLAEREADTTVAGTAPSNMTLFSAAASANNIQQFNERAQAQLAADAAVTTGLVNGLAVAKSYRGVLRQRFYKAPSPERSEQLTAPLLEDFELQRTENQIRIIDSDGSVYEGAIAANRTELEGRRDKAEFEAAKRDSVRRNLTIAGQSSSVATVSAPADMPITFRATGTNRTLNQLVVFDGTIRSGAPAPIGAYFVQGQSADSPATRHRLPQQPAPGKTAARPVSRAQTLTNRLLQVEGKARVGATNQLEIRALPR